MRLHVWAKRNARDAGDVCHFRYVRIERDEVAHEGWGCEQLPCARFAETLDD